MPYHLFRFFFLLMPAAIALSAAVSSHDMIEIPFSSTTYRGFNGSSSVPNPGYTWWLGIPDSNEGTTVSYCPLSSLLYTWVRIGPFSESQPTDVWAGSCNANCNPQCNCPSGGNCCDASVCPVIYPNDYLVTIPGAVYISQNFPDVRGLRFDGAFQGVIDSSSEPSAAETQAVYYSQRICYDAGPEFGFYRKLPTDNNLHFYFGQDVNCNSRKTAPVFCPTGTCMHEGTTCTTREGVEVNPEIHDYQLIASPGCFGSAGYVHLAWLEDTTGMGCADGKCGFLVQIIDSCGYSIYYNIFYIDASWPFVNVAKLMLKGESPGYLNIAAQKNVRMTANGATYGTMTSSSLGLGVDRLFYYNQDRCHVQQHGVPHAVCDPAAPIHPPPLH